MKEFIGHPTTTSKVHTFVTIKATQLKAWACKSTSPNQTHKPSTQDHPIVVKPLPTPPRSNTSDYPLLTQLPIPLPSDSVQNHGAFIPHKVFNKLSNAF